MSVLSYVGTRTQPYVKHLTKRLMGWTRPRLRRTTQTPCLRAWFTRWSSCAWPTWTGSLFSRRRVCSGCPETSQPSESSGQTSSKVGGWQRVACLDCKCELCTFTNGRSPNGHTLAQSRSIMPTREWIMHSRLCKYKAQHACRVRLPRLLWVWWKSDLFDAILRLSTGKKCWNQLFSQSGRVYSRARLLPTSLYMYTVGITLLGQMVAI